MGDNGKTPNTDLFQKRTAALTRGILLQNYIYQVWKNWKQVLQINVKIEQDVFNEKMDYNTKPKSVHDHNEK